ncbi:MAG TPA: hypothetical protein VH415_03015 [Nitrososphaeraceae archaeon]
MNTLRLLAYFLVLFTIVAILVSKSNVSAQPKTGIEILRIVLNVQVGGGNTTQTKDQFNPPVINITRNETLKWINPTGGSPYPHTVTLVAKNSSMPIPNMTIAFDNKSTPQGIINNIRHALSNQSMNPSKDTDLFLNASVINSTAGEPIFLNPLSNFDHNGAEYTINGTEKYVNSGLLWNWVKEIPKNYPKSFTVRFPVEGTYEFMCLFHPDTKVVVNVKPATVMGITLP